MSIIKSIALHFMGNTVTVHQNATGFCLNDLHRAYTGGKGREKQPRDWIKWNVCAENTTRFQVTPIKASKGTKGGTYANEQGVYAYAEWLDADFHAAVLSTFSAAARGDGEKAVTIAQSAVTLTWRETLREGNKAFTQAIFTAANEGTIKGVPNHCMANIQSLVCKAVTGLDGTAFKARYGKSARDFLCDQDDGKRLGCVLKALPFCSITIPANIEGRKPA